jgi:excinuclease ABC subunit A
MQVDISKIDPKKNIIIIKGSGTQFKNVDVVIPRNKLVVITGLSGSEIKFSF